MAKQIAIRKKLKAMKLEIDMPLIKHFAIFDDWIAEMTCAGANLEKYDKVQHLLMTLPTTYDGVITLWQPTARHRSLAT